MLQLKKEPHDSSYAYKNCTSITLLLNCERDLRISKKLLIFSYNHHHDSQIDIVLVTFFPPTFLLEWRRLKPYMI